MLHHHWLSTPPYLESWRLTKAQNCNVQQLHTVHLASLNGYRTLNVAQSWKVSDWSGLLILWLIWHMTCLPVCLESTDVITTWKYVGRLLTKVQRASNLLPSPYLWLRKTLNVQHTKDILSKQHSTPHAILPKVAISSSIVVFWYWLVMIINSAQNYTTTCSSAMIRVTTCILHNACHYTTPLNTLLYNYVPS